MFIPVLPGVIKQMEETPVFLNFDFVPTFCQATTVFIVSADWQTNIPREQAAV
jgi:hypothetical protein